jgi:hypothetical protein
MNRKLYFLAFLLLFTSSVSAKQIKADFIKLGSLRYSLNQESIESAEIVDEEITISALATKGGNSADLVFRFVDMRDLIQDGAEFKVTTGEQLTQGEVNINGSFNIKIKGEDAVISTDDLTKISGIVKITSVDGDNFTFVFTTNVKRLKFEAPSIGDNLDARVTNKIKVVGRITTDL